MLEYLALIAVGFVAGIINTIAGGGSLLTLPMLIFLGLPANVANGTNRIAILIQNFSSNAGFRSKGISAYPFSIYLGISAMLGSFVGAYLAAIYVKDDTFKKILAIVMVVVVAFMIFKPKNKEQNTIEKTTGKHFWFSVFLFFFIGIYGGFIQAGTGLFILLVLSSVNGFSLVKSNAAKTTIVILYTIMSVAVFAYNGLIDYKLGLSMALGNASGAWFASRWSVKKGDGLVKIFLAVMVTVMAVKLWFFS